MLIHLSKERSKNGKCHFPTNADSTLKTTEGSWMWTQLHRLPNSSLPLYTITDEVRPVKPLCDGEFTAVICRLSLNCAFDVNPSWYFNSAPVATETYRTLINFHLFQWKTPALHRKLWNYINYSTEYNKWATCFSMGLYLIILNASKVSIHSLCWFYC